jgi:hypothetical protein
MVNRAFRLDRQAELRIVSSTEWRIFRDYEEDFMDKTTDKKAYEAPQLVVHGSLEDLTQAGKNGGFLDADFSAGTPKGSLTFS